MTCDYGTSHMGVAINFGYGSANLCVMSTIGERIRRLRKAKPMTQIQLSAAVGIDQSTLSDIENGSSTKPEVFLAICRELQTTPEHLVHEENRDDIGEAKVLAIYRSLDDDQRQNMIAMASALAQIRRPESGGGQHKEPTRRAA